MLGTTVSSGGTEKQGYLNVPPAEEVLSYDTRGNLIKDARWEYTWDVNNRLVELNEYPVIDGYDSVDWRYPFRKIRLAYDYMGRRIAKSVWVWLYDDNFGWRWRLEKDLRYVYDGWQMIAELDHTFAPPTAGWQPALMWGGNELNPRRAQEGFGGFTGISGVAAERCVVRTYLWGQDLSGTMTGAGGVGGLLSVTHQGVTYHTCSDANGNITGLLAANGADAGQLIARFDYDPFGNRITNTGPDVEICPMGFSTKYTDSETGLVDYGLRIYSPMMGRFLSRDPIEEEGGINLYGFVGNDPVNRTDYLGLFWPPGSQPFPAPNLRPSPSPPPPPPVQPPPDNSSGLREDLARQLFGDCAVSIFKKWDSDMTKRNVKGGDKWHHCMANCEVAHKCGKDKAKNLAMWKEFNDLLKNRLQNYSADIFGTNPPRIGDPLEMAKDALEDMKHNSEGYECNSIENCECCCYKYKVKGLP
jgi:RHS repeat-associated protein